VNIYRPAWLLPRDQQFHAKNVGTLQVRQGLLTAIVAIAGIGRRTWQGLIRSRLPPRGRRVQCAANDHASRLNTNACPALRL
jgi:hypothetical protein